MANKYCTKCGAEMPEDAKFCTKCGQPFDPEAISYQARQEKANEEKKINKKAIYALLSVLGGLLLVVLGSMFYSEYSERREARLEREHFVQDSIKRAEIEAEKIKMEEELKDKEEKDFAQFFDQFTIEKFLNLIRNPENESYAQKCGLSLVYKKVTEEEYGDDIRIVYGRRVEKGNMTDYGYHLKLNSEHACYFEYQADTSSGASLCFKNQSDANHFWEKIWRYGIIQYGDAYFFPQNKLPNGESVQVDSLAYEGQYAVSYYVSKPHYNEGVYEISIGMDY